MNRQKAILKKLSVTLKRFLNILWGILCIPFIPIILVSILGHALFKTVLGTSKNAEGVIEIIKSDINNIFKFIYIPISLLSIIGNELYVKSKSFGDFINKQFDRFSKLSKRNFHEYFPSFNRRRFEKLKRHLFVNKNETFLNSNLHYIVLLATFGLQCISFFTTFRGTLSFFEGVHSIAPIIFTFVLQGMLLILSNIAFSKKRRYAMRKFLLLFLCIVSIVLSYVGISNSSLPPTEDYKKEYERFSQKYTEIYKELELTYVANNSSVQFENIFTAIDNIESYAEDQIAALNAKKKDLSKITKYTTRRTYSNNGDVAYEYVLTNEYSNAENENIDIDRKIVNIETKCEDLDYQTLENDIKKSNINNILDNESLHQYISDNENIVSKYRTLISKYNILANFMNREYNHGDNFKIFSESIADILSYNLIGNIGNLALKDFTNIENRAQDYLAELNTSLGKHFNNIYDMLLGGTQRATYNDKVMLYTKEEIDLKYELLGNALYSIGNPELNAKYSGENESLSNIYNDLSFYDSYIIAFSRFSSNLSYALIMLFFACLVDGLTVLIPLFTEKRRESILYAKSNLDILADHEDILEDSLLSCAFNINEKYIEVDEYGYYDESVYEKMLDVFSEYLKAFEPSPYTTDLGYSKKLPVLSMITDGNVEFVYPEADGKFSKKYHELNSLLLDLKYIKYVSKYEYYLLKCDYYNIEPYKKQEEMFKGKANIEKGYFLLKGQFAMWLNESKVGIFNMKKGSRNNEKKDGNIS